MLTPEEIAAKAERKYPAMLRAWLTGGSAFPIIFPVGRLSGDLGVRQQQIERLRNCSKEGRGIGYSIQWETSQHRTLGRQTVPSQIVIATLDDYLALRGKQKEFANFTADVELIRRRCPALETWLLDKPMSVIEHHGKWDGLLTVCDYFVKHPQPGVYIRELPIPVHTKFIEWHTAILRELLDRLLPLETINGIEADFTRRFGLKDRSALVRLRLLDSQLEAAYGLRLDELALPVDQLAYLLADHLRPRQIIIVENQINFLTLPRFPDCVGLWGGGFALHLLREVAWLRQCNLLYWGDLDAHGFQMLSDLRSLFPHTRSVMMDEQTFADHQAYVVSGKVIPLAKLSHLTDTERRLAAHLIQSSLRLEQEHIAHRYAVAALKAAIGLA
jgi:hypothetical protein